MAFSAGNYSNQKVKTIVTPHAGQSVNPAAQAHREILKKVISEEEKQIEDDYRGSLQQSIHSGKAALSKLKDLVKRKEGEESSSDEAVSDSDASDSDSVEEDEVPGNKPVDRRKKLTKTQRNQKKERRERHEAQVEKAKQRKHEKQYQKIGIFIHEDKRENKESKARIEKRQKEAQAERELQETQGIVNKGAKIGRKTYKMRKTDFQLEEELAGSLREVRA
mmetsp:Transcript_1536/g.2235  ORF Transcript_1536/g.2235 Transcript_1536/m.2235 type:complete len:221 (+) Transcript_1536:399-1061(+)